MIVPIRVRYCSGVVEQAPTLRVAFVAAYPRYVANVLAQRGIAIQTVIADGIVVGTSVLDGLLASLEVTPMGLQRQSPLELFREALRPVHDALEVAGVDAPPLDDQQRALLPWDTYALSPGSSRQLGEQAHEAHIRWGLQKARAQSQRPRAGLLCAEADAPRLLQQLNELGYEVCKLPSSRPLTLGLVDIEMPGADSVIADVSVAGVRVVAFGSQPDDMVQVRTKALGAGVVVSRDDLLSDVAAYLPTIV